MLSKTNSSIFFPQTFKCTIILLCLLLFSHHFTASAQVADKLVTGKIWTGNAAQPWADAMAIYVDKIIAVGTEKELKPFTNKKTLLIKAAKGQLIVPGFIDNHTHFIDGGYMMASVQLRDAKTPAEFIQRIEEYAKTVTPGTWIMGGNWDHKNWNGELPDKSWIDSVTKNNPVWINRVDGHMGLANSVALQIAGITAATPDVSGGSIERKNGQPTGLLIDNAEELVQRAVPDPSAEIKDRAMDAAMKYVASNGVTSVVSLTGIGVNNYLDVFQRAHDQHRQITRVYGAMMLTNWKQLADKIKETGRGDDWLTIGIVKGFMDGSLGSHTAAFKHPFTDAPSDSGLLVMQRDTLYQLVKAADSAGLQVTVHAIGDRSIHMLLDIYEKVENLNGNRDRRFRMEHAQHLDTADIKRFAQLKVIASMQPYHAIDDGRWAEKVIGHERAKHSYALRELLDAKTTLAFGSDWFVAPAAPLLGIYAATTRRTLDGKNPDGWIPEQKITVQEALKAYTIDGAYAIFQEKNRGSLEKGKLADFILLDKDITEIAPAIINSVKVLKTFVGGKMVYALPR